MPKRTLVACGFFKTRVKGVNLKIKVPLPNLTSNFQTHNNVGDKILLCIQVDIYLIYIPTKYKEN